VTAPDPAWVADITYVRLLREFVYLAVQMDVFTRSIRGWRQGRSLEGDLTLGALKGALPKSTLQIHLSDQGLQYA
jgi:putative transposase